MSCSCYLLKWAGAVLCVLFLCGAGFRAHGEEMFEVALKAQKLRVLGLDGTVVEELSPAMIGKIVGMPPATVVRLSFGRNGRGEWTAVVTAADSARMALTFRVAGAVVSMQERSMATVVFIDEQRVRIEAGSAGGVMVNGNAIDREVVVEQGRTLPLLEPATSIPVAEAKPAVPAAPAPASEQAAPRLLQAEAARKLGAEKFAAWANDGGRVTKTLYWAEPLTTPEPNDALAVPAGEMRAMEKRGTVQLTPPDSKAGQELSEGQRITSSSRIITAGRSSVAVLIGGVNSVRLAPESEVVIEMELKDGKRLTRCELVRGLLFCKVGRRQGEEQQFRVQSTRGFLLSKGGDFAVMQDEVGLHVFGVVGRAEVFDAGGQQVAAQGEAVEDGRVVYAGTATVTEEWCKREVLRVLSVASALNAKVKPLLQRQREGGALTPAQLNYLHVLPKMVVSWRATPASWQLVEAVQLPDALSVEELWSVGVPWELPLGKASLAAVERRELLGAPLNLDLLKRPVYVPSRPPR